MRCNHRVCSGVLLGLLCVVASGAVTAADIVATAKADGHFTKLLAANATAGTDALLMQPGPFTVFAPDDEAFGRIPASKLNALMSPDMRTMLKVTLANHVVTGLVDLTALEKALQKSDAVVVVAANNMPLVFKHDGDKLTVNGARIIKGPIKTDNGLVYVVDTVLTPAMPLQAHY